MAWILSFFRTLAMAEVLKPLLARVCVYLGMSVVSYVGFGALWSSVDSHLASSLSGASATAMSYLSLADIPQAMSVVMSAYASKLTIKGLTAAGTLKQVLWKPYQQGSLFPGA